MFRLERSRNGEESVSKSLLSPSVDAKLVSFGIVSDLLVYWTRRLPASFQIYRSCIENADNGIDAVKLAIGSMIHFCLTLVWCEFGDPLWLPRIRPATPRTSYVLSYLTNLEARSISCSQQRA